jgi:hypothetical protein
MMSPALRAALAVAFVPFAAAPAAAQQVVTLPAQDRALQASAEEVFRIGKIDGADWEVFGENPDFQFDAAGNLYVLDRQSFRVVVVSPQGRLVRQFGRQGEGPGELRSPMGFAVLRDGTVAIGDQEHGAFLMFGPDGAFQRSVSFRTQEVLTILGELHADPRGGAVYSAGRPPVRIQVGPGRPWATLTDRPIIRIGLGGQGGPQPFYSPWSPPSEAPPVRAAGVPTRALVVPPGASYWTARAFEPGLFSGVLPNGGMVVSDSSAYNLKVLSPDGRVERLLRRPLQPTPVTQQIQRAEQERRVAELAASGGSPNTARQQIDQLQFYPELSVVSGIRTGWTGKIWVTRRGPGNDPTARGPLDILTAAGEYLGTIPANGMRAPRAFGPDGLAAWLEPDQFDTPIIVVRRLPAELR